jgi:hypothetical protein
MTANRDFDAVARAWLDLMPDEAPDRVIESVLLAVDAEPQVRVPRIGGWRLIPMNRLALASAAAVIVAAGLFFVAPRPSGPGAGPTPSPTATASPAASPIGSPTRSSAPAAAAEALRTTWLADPAQLPGLTEPSGLASNLAFIVNGSGNGAWVRANDRNPTALRSTASSTAGDVITLSLDRTGAGCAAGDLGSYRWSISADGLVLSVTAVEEACAVRKQALERRWVRSHMGASAGGAGVIDVFDPAFRITLPAASWQAITYEDVMETQSEDLVVYAGKDPQGFSEPCSPSGGEQLAIAPGLDAFEAYIRSLPTLTVTATDLVIGGYPARHLDITSTPTAACPRGTEIIQWRAKGEPGDVHWILGSGDPDSMHVVALPDATILLQLIAQNGATVDTRTIIDSIQFVDSLSEVGSPTP